MEKGKQTYKLPEGWIQVKNTNVAFIEDRLRKPVNSYERQKRIEGKAISSLFPYYGATGQVGWIDNYLTDGTIYIFKPATSNKSRTLTLCNSTKIQKNGFLKR